jgi:putative secretion ATPase (PEP-CTERM system associated)
MYREFFGLSLRPFELVPNPQFLYLSESHKKAINYLQYGIYTRAGFILFTGEVGSGKTTILRNLIRSANPDTDISMVFNTRVTGKQLIAMINEDFGLDPRGKTIPSLLRDLNDFLIARHAQEIHPIIIIDEAQNLSAEALEEVRMLSNLETDQSKLVQIVLVGQPELRDQINNPSLRQLRQRINLHCHLEPLSRQETEEYVFHRLEVAGNRDALVFEDGTFDLIYAYSGGIPRVINLFCDFLLLDAFAQETNVLSLEMVSQVMKDIAWKADDAPPPRKETTKKEARAGQTVDLMDRQLHPRIIAISDVVKKLEQKLQSLDDVTIHISQQQRQIQRVEELLGCFVEVFRQAHPEIPDPRQLAEMKGLIDSKEKVEFMSQLLASK